MEQFFNDLEKAFEEERNKIKDMSEYEKFEYLLKNNRISASSIQRVFSYSYPKAQGIIEELIECGVIKKHQSSYVIISESRFYAYISAKTSSKPIDCMGEIIRQEWISFETECRRIAVFTESQLDEFKQLVKETWLYFKQLNSRKNIPLGSRDGISYYSCMSIINQLYFYSANKIDITDCDYEDYDDLCNYPKATLEITIKATQLISESLAFSLSLIPNMPLENTIGVIYNGTTTDYDVEKQNVEDIIKLVCDFPHSKN